MFPEELKYTKEHEWLRIEKGENGQIIGTIGITDFAQSELGELVYIEVDTVGEQVEKDGVFGTVEAVKTTSELFMPINGKVLEFNPEIDENEGDNPAVVNEDPYGKGWIVKIEINNEADLEVLLDAEAYEDLVS